MQTHNSERNQLSVWQAKALFHVVPGRWYAEGIESQHGISRCSLTDGATCSNFVHAFVSSDDGPDRLDDREDNEEFHLPGESSDTGVLDGVGLCPGGRKCEGDPLLEPPPVAAMRNRKAWEMMVNCRLSTRPPPLDELTSMKILMWRTMATLIWSAEWHSTNTWRLCCFHHLLVLRSAILKPNFHLNSENRETDGLTIASWGPNSGLFCFCYFFSMPQPSRAETWANYSNRLQANFIMNRGENSLQGLTRYQASLAVWAGNEWKSILAAVEGKWGFVSSMEQNVSERSRTYFLWRGSFASDSMQRIA